MRAAIPSTMDSYDCAVVGAGFGGLGAALTLAERGARVALFEALRYPGGCASTFTRHGFEFESGATLFAGFGAGQLFDRWIARHQMPVRTAAIDPIVELRAPGFHLAIPPDRARMVDLLAAFPGSPRDAIHRYFDRQERVASALWALFDDPRLLPPFGLRELVRHARRMGAYAPILPLVGRPLVALLARMGLADFAPLRLFLDAACQITVQTSVSEAEAPFALAAVDYLFRGTRHVVGGIGQLAWAMADATKRLGGTVRTSDAVTRLERHGDRWRVHSRRGVVEADTVIANVLPHDLLPMLDARHEAEARMADARRGVEDGWGAAMLYLVIPADTPGVRSEAHHLELIDDAGAPLTEGNHVFVSISSSDEPRGRASLDAHGRVSHRTLTASTHVPMRSFTALDAAAQARAIDTVHAAMRATLARRAPAIAGAVVHEMTASPRTFERFTRRHQGYVGGVPKRAGLHHYARLTPLDVAPGLFLVGDSVFPGQSTLATAIGGVKVAERIARGVL